MDSTQTVEKRGTDSLATPSNIKEQHVESLSEALNALLADVFVLYVKTKNFH